MVHSPVLDDCNLKSDFVVIMFLTKIIELSLSSVILLNVPTTYSVVTEKTMFKTGKGNP